MEEYCTIVSDHWSKMLRVFESADVVILYQSVPSLSPSLSLSLLPSSTSPFLPSPISSFISHPPPQSIYSSISLYRSRGEVSLPLLSSPPLFPLTPPLPSPPLWVYSFSVAIERGWTHLTLLSLLFLIPYPLIQWTLSIISFLFLLHPLVFPSLHSTVWSLSFRCLRWWYFIRRREGNWRGREEIFLSEMSQSWSSLSSKGT